MLRLPQRNLSKAEIEKIYLLLINSLQTLANIVVENHWKPTFGNFQTFHWSLLRKRNIKRFIVPKRTQQLKSTQNNPIISIDNTSKSNKPVGYPSFVPD